MKYIAAISASIALAGCAPLQKTVIVSARISPEEVAAANAAGTGVLRGSALIRQRGGGVVSCAGTEVDLIASTAYATERIVAIYGNASRGFNPAYGGSRLRFSYEDPLYSATKKTTMCDAQGYFKFSKVPSGTYYLTSSILWKISDFSYEGGALMQSVTIADGEEKEIVLAP